MLHVLFILLKILGILLLLLVGVLLLVLLAPLRYSFKLEKEEQVSPEFSVRVTWLCWLFYFKASYIEKVFDYRIRILGHQIAGNQKEFLEKQKKKTEKAQEKRRKEKENRKKKSQKKEKELPVTISEEKVSVTEKPEEDLLKEKESEEGHSGESVKEENIKDADSHKELPKEKQVKEKTDNSSKRKGSFLKKGKARIKSLKDAKSNLDQFPWREWLELGKDIVIRFFKHVLPQKLRGTITFGCSDPAYTGYVTGIAAVFYPKYGESFSLYPDFERKVFAAQCEGKGRIRLGYILVLVVSILKEKSVRTMIKRMILD
ncbi:MAG: DUF2953 domain-containing protein [Eubacterium sp.]|nr:DUF2953 domain-containing protein [Eubacterium sp.]